MRPDELINDIAFSPRQLEGMAALGIDVTHFARDFQVRDVNRAALDDSRPVVSQTITNRTLLRKCPSLIFFPP